MLGAWMLLAVAALLQTLPHLIAFPPFAWSVFVVTHEIPIRYAINAADGSDNLDGPTHRLPNAAPYLVDEAALARAVEGIQRLA